MKSMFGSLAKNLLIGGAFILIGAALTTSVLIGQIGTVVFAAGAVSAIVSFVVSD